MRLGGPVFLLLFSLTSCNLYGACSDGLQPSGAKYRICLPTNWNRELLVYAHGYVSADQPIAIPENQLTLPDGTSLPDVFTSLGYAVAISSYRTNGLSILEGRDDLKELTELFTQKVGKPSATYIGGVSEGGLVAALSAEQLPSTYDAAIATCGPIGSFTGQINYIGDVRLLFDYFFPGTLPGTVISVPPQLSVNWETVYVPAIKAALQTNLAAAQNFINASHVPVSTDPGVTTDNIIAALSYSANATNDAKLKLKGQPFDNKSRFYFGSTNDLELNARIARYVADPSALQAMQPYETTGKPRIPLVTLHTTADPVVPWLHEAGYYFKAQQNGSIEKLKQIPVFRNGHCSFQVGDVLWAFIVMLAQQQGRSPQTLIKNLTDSQRQMLLPEMQGFQRR